MRFPLTALLIPVLFVPAAASEDVWEARLEPAFRAALESGTADSLAKALDIAYRADAWDKGLELAARARRDHPDDEALRGLSIRALWRGGRLLEAEELAGAFSPDTTSRPALTTLIQINLARGQRERAVEFGRRLEALEPRTAVELFAVASVRMLEGDHSQVVRLLKRAEALLDPANGYPETLLEESIDGLPEYFGAIGKEPINQVSGFGVAEMPGLAGLGLPACTVFINGKGPYRLLVDTGGSITVSLDTQIAEELGLPTLSTSSVRGVTGKQDARQSMIDRLVIGEIECKRVMTHVFEMPEIITGTIAGVLGTGVFGDARMTLDFGTGRMRVDASSRMKADGAEVPLRIVGDAKLMAFVELDGRPSLALLDSGADAVALSAAAAHSFFPDFQPTRLPLAQAAGVGSGAGSVMMLVPGVSLDWAGRQEHGFGGIALGALDETLNPMMGVETNILLGMPVFREMRSFTVDFPTARGWVDWIDAGDAAAEDSDDGDESEDGRSSLAPRALPEHVCSV